MSAHLDPSQKACSVLGKFLHYRGLTPVIEPLRPDHVSDDSLVDGLTPGDSIKTILDTLGRWELVAKDSDDRLTFIVVLTNQSPEAHKAKSLESLLVQSSGNVARLVAPTGIKNPQLHEVIVIAPSDAVDKKPLKEIVNGVRATMSEVHLGFYPYTKFSTVVPEAAIVPRHSVASPEMIEAFLKTYYLTKSQLPAILNDDPAVIWCGAHRGDVVEVMRVSETTGSYINVLRLVR